MKIYVSNSPLKHFVPTRISIVVVVLAAVMVVVTIFFIVFRFVSNDKKLDLLCYEATLTSRSLITL